MVLFYYEHSDLCVVGDEYMWYPDATYTGRDDPFSFERFALTPAQMKDLRNGHFGNSNGNVITKEIPI